MDGGVLAVIDFHDCGWGPLMLDIATVLASTRRTCRDGAVYRRFARRFLDAYASVRPLPDAMGDIVSYLVMRDLVIVGFVLGSANPTVATWGHARVAGIIGNLRSYLPSGTYPGDDIADD